MRKTIFILPGFQMQVKDKPFKWLVDFLKSKGYNVIGAPVKWERTILTKNAEDFKSFYNENKGNENYVLGFSYGAVIALLTANELKPKKIFLCSLSPAFKEDNINVKKWIKKYIGINRFNDMGRRSGRKIAKELAVPSVIFYGKKEGRLYPKLKTRCEETARLAKNSKLVKVENAPHKIDFPAYIEVIKKNI